LTLKTTRRAILRCAVLGAAAAVGGRAAPAVLAAARPRVVVIGGGAGGATLARLLALAAPDLSVTLVNDKPAYVTCFLSNLTLAGLRAPESIAWHHDRLRDALGVTLVIDRATAIDHENGAVRLAGGGRLDYDSLVVAPGIDFRLDAIEGYGPEARETMPHAWQSGEEAAVLKRRLEAMEDGGTFAICPPANPYRCPPAPYERASLVAHYFKTHKPNATIVIIDSKDGYSKQDLFEAAWGRFYPGMIEWLPADFTGGGIKAVDAKSSTIITDDDAFEASVANVIPPQRAGAIAVQAGLADETGWCPVDPLSFASKLVPRVYLIGDSIAAGDMPKSAFAANSQAKVCAAAILKQWGYPADEAAVLVNTCFSFITADHAIKVGAGYQADSSGIERVESFISQVEESDEERAATAREAEAWYDTVTAEMFGAVTR
jgi:NADPH-dependent 2,4-dienoyl-CoA reductase/sulfur reductase-like enzyme